MVRGGLACFCSCSDQHQGLFLVTVSALQGWRTGQAPSLRLGTPTRPQGSKQGCFILCTPQHPVALGIVELASQACCGE